MVLSVAFLTGPRIDTTELFLLPSLLQTEGVLASRPSLNPNLKAFDCEYVCAWIPKDVGSIAGLSLVTKCP